MGIENILLLIVGGVDLIMGVLVIYRGVHNNKVNLYYSLFTFSCFAWAISEFLARILASDIWVFFVRLTYFSSLVIAISFFYFSIYFPYIKKKVGKITNILLLILFVLFSVVIFNDKLLITGGIKDLILTEYITYFNYSILTTFSIFFVLIVLIALYNIFKKYLSAERIWKQSIRDILIAVLIAFILGSYLDLILPYYSNFHYFWLAPILTFFINYVVFRIIYGKSAK